MIEIGSEELGALQESTCYPQYIGGYNSGVKVYYSTVNVRSRGEEKITARELLGSDSHRERTTTECSSKAMPSATHVDDIDDKDLIQLSSKPHALLPFLQLQSATSLSRLYQSPSSCLSIFRSKKFINIPILLFLTLKSGCWIL